tara:strand:- start:97 stop:438 length:342 start_codon:yes stop_codon:yes gene_type:complete
MQRYMRENEAPRKMSCTVLGGALLLLPPLSFSSCPSTVHCSSFAIRDHAAAGLRTTRTSRVCLSFFPVVSSVVSSAAAATDDAPKQTALRMSPISTLSAFVRTSVKHERAQKC